MKRFVQGTTFICLLILGTGSTAGVDSYPQAKYECSLSADKLSKDPGGRALTVKVRNRSEHISIYGFKVQATYLDCKLPQIKYTEEFISRACTVMGKTSLSLGSMARPPREDVIVPPGQTRTFNYRFRYPGKPRHKNYQIEYCHTHSTATFTAAEAADVLGLEKKKTETPGYWKQWWQKIKGWF